MNLCAENVEKEKKNGGSGSITAILWIHPPLCGLARRLFLCSYGLASGWILREWWNASCLSFFLMIHYK
jgi:hypothetical protein